MIGVDILPDRVSALNAGKSPIIDAELSRYLAEKNSTCQQVLIWRMRLLVQIT